MDIEKTKKQHSTKKNATKSEKANNYGKVVFPNK